MAIPSPGRAPNFTAFDYAQAMANLLPRGRAWPRDPDTNLMALIGALAPTYERSGTAAGALIADIFPATTQALLVEWEETLGLPDPCTPLNPTVAQRSAAVLAKFIAGGGQSVPYFVAYAAALGVTITITEFAPARAGWSRAGDPLYGQAWAHAWAVNAPLTTITYARAGHSAAGDPLASWGNAEFECRMRQIAPAHTILTFHYT